MSSLRQNVASSEWPKVCAAWQLYLVRVEFHRSKLSYREQFHAHSLFLEQRTLLKHSIVQPLGASLLISFLIKGS